MALEKIIATFERHGQEDARAYVLDTIHAALMRGDTLTYERIMARLVPGGTSWEALLYRAAREAVKEADEMYPAFDFCKRHNDLLNMK